MHHSCAKEAASVVGAVFCLLRYAPLVKLPALPIVVLDTETTGFVPRTHRVIEYACVALSEGKPVSEYEQLLSIPADIPPHVQVITNIRNEDLVGKPAFADIHAKIAAMVTPETLVVGQNVRFDIGMLKGEGWDLSAQPWIDTSMLASLVFPELASYSLGYLSEVLKLNHEPKHRALGDVHATVELLAKCWERLCQLPAASRAQLQSIAMRSPAGYRMLFAALEGEATGKAKPTWLKRGITRDTATRPADAVPSEAEKGSVCLLEEDLDPHFVLRCLQPAKGKRRWVAVKNLEAWVRRFGTPSGSCVLFPPELVLRPDAGKQFLAQETFTEDECTLAMKLELYAPTVRADVPVHGDEHAVWTGKLACARGDAAYIAQVQADAQTVIIDHQELLKLAQDSSLLLEGATEVVIDDASMLEDTATAAYGWHCAVAPLRAAASGDALLTKFVDLLELWIEKTRGGTDVRYVVGADIGSREAEGLREIVQQVLKSASAPRVQQYLESVAAILDPTNLAGRITWMEVFQDGSRHLRSVPEDIASVLKQRLFDAYPTSLIVPPKSALLLKSILPTGMKTRVTTLALPPPSAPNIRFPEPSGLQQIFAGTHTGKTVLLVGSKRIIEDVFVRHSLRLEKEGVTLICQGFNGGQGRMQAEFAAAVGPAILVVTPWTYETFELPPNTVDRLLVQTLPFDHPSHAVVGRRSERFRDPFNEYSLPRVLHRLFRLLRTFCKHRTTDAAAEFIDERLRTKAYGKVIRAMLEQLSATAGAPLPSGFARTTVTEAPKRTKTAKKKPESGQMSLL